MALFISGFALWSVAHLFPVVARGRRNRIVGTLGLKAYRGLFAAVILAAIALMILGWPSASATEIYQPPPWGSAVNYGLMAASVFLFAASFLKNNLKRLIRHPQLTGLLVWGAGHLIVNGSIRSVVLFGGMVVWALVAMAAFNRRDGEWKKSDAVPIVWDGVLVAISAGVFFVIVFFHPG